MDSVPSLAADASDSLLLERQALGRSLRCIRFSPTAFLVMPDDISSRVAFFGTLSPLTSRVAVEIVRSRRLLNSALSADGIPTADAVVLKVQRPDAVVKAARRLGYPVQLRATNGKPLRQASSSIGDAEELSDVAERLTGTTVCVQRALPGAEYRVLAGARSAHSILRLEHSPSRDAMVIPPVPLGPGHVMLHADAGTNVPGRLRATREETEGEIADIATRTIAAIPGLGIAEVSISEIGRTESGSPDVIVNGVDEQPTLALHHLVDPPSADVGEAMMIDALDGHRIDANRDRGREVGRLEVCIAECTDPDEVRRHVRRTASALGVTASVHDEPDPGTVAVVVRGERSSLLAFPAVLSSLLSRVVTAFVDSRLNTADDRREDAAAR